MSPIRTLFTLVALLSAFACAHAKDLVGSDQQVYTQEIELSSTTQSGDRYATVTGRVLMEGRLAATAKLFSDVDNLTTWVESLIAAKEISARAPTDRSVHMRYSAPAGLDDRDGLMRFVAARESPGVLVMSIEDVPGFAPQANAVRMKDVRGRYRVEQLSPNTLAVEFRLHFDSSAKPVFLANLNVKQQVQKTLLRMRQRIEGPLRNATVDGPLARALGLDG
jgi:hypothetical protein